MARGRTDQPKVLKAYLRARVRAWLREARDRTQKSFAALSGVSESHLTAILKGEGYSEVSLYRILKALGLTYAQAADLASKWAADHPEEIRAEQRLYPVVASDAKGGRADAALTPNLREALESVAREGRTVDRAVVAALAVRCVRERDRSVESWRFAIVSLTRALSESDYVARMNSVSKAEEATLPLPPHHETDRSIRRRR